MIQGSCFCGTVRFEIQGELPDLYQCHCSLCRKVTGSSANAATTVPREAFHWTGGREVVRSFVRSTGYRNDFCSTCGSSVPNLDRSGDGVWVPVGLLDTPTAARVTKHVFVASKAEWDEIGGSAPQIPRRREQV